MKVETFAGLKRLYRKMVVRHTKQPTNTIEWVAPLSVNDSINPWGYYDSLGCICHRDQPGDTITKQWYLRATDISGLSNRWLTDQEAQKCMEQYFYLAATRRYV